MTWGERRTDGELKRLAEEVNLPWWMADRYTIESSQGQVSSEGGSFIDSDLAYLVAAANALPSLLARLASTESELLNQWEIAHSEMCTNEWPHDGKCYWPKPAALGERSKDS